MSDLHPLKLTVIWQCQIVTHSNWSLFNSVRPSPTETDHYLTVSDLHPLKLTIIWQCQTFTHSNWPLFDSVRPSPTQTDRYLTVSDLPPLKLTVRPSPTQTDRYLTVPDVRCQEEESLDLMKEVLSLLNNSNPDGASQDVLLKTLCQWLRSSPHSILLTPCIKASSRCLASLAQTVQVTETCIEVYFTSCEWAGLNG